MRCKGLTKTGIAKDRTAQQGANFKFRGIDDVYNALAPLLAANGLCILPRMLSRKCDERQSTAGKALFYVTVEAEFDFVSAEDGSKHIVKTFGEAMDSGDKGHEQGHERGSVQICLFAKRFRSQRKATTMRTQQRTRSRTPCRKASSSITNRRCLTRRMSNRCAPSSPRHGLQPKPSATLPHAAP